MSRPWNPHSARLPRPASRHLCATPEDRLPPYIFIWQPVLEAEQHLALCGLLITTLDKQAERRLTADQAEIIGRVQSRLVRLRRAGQLPEGVCSIWTTPDEAGGRCTPVSVQSEAWLKQRMSRHAVFSLRVERTPGIVH